MSLCCSYVVSQVVQAKTPAQYWAEQTGIAGAGGVGTAPDMKNCLLCEQRDSGACRMQPSCVYCETTVTALCERSAPCLRCTGTRCNTLKSL